MSPNWKGRAGAGAPGPYGSGEGRGGARSRCPRSPGPGSPGLSATRLLAGGGADMEDYAGAARGIRLVRCRCARPRARGIDRRVGISRRTRPQDIGARSRGSCRIPCRRCTMFETISHVLGHGKAFSVDWGLKACNSSGRIDTKKRTSGAMPFAAPQAHQSAASTRISRWTKREASGVGMRWTTPRSPSRLPQAISAAPSGSSYSPHLRSSTS